MDKKMPKDLAVYWGVTIAILLAIAWNLTEIAIKLAAISIPAH